MVGQIQHEYEAKDEHMARYLQCVKAHLAKLADWRIKCISYEENRKAYALVGVFVALLITKSIMLLVYVQPTPPIALEWIHDIAHTDVEWM